jgi:hypothetical protein
MISGFGFIHSHARLLYGSITLVPPWYPLDSSFFLKLLFSLVVLPLLLSTLYSFNLKILDLSCYPLIIIVLELTDFKILIWSYILF